VQILLGCWVEKAWIGEKAWIVNVISFFRHLLPVYLLVLLTFNQLSLFEAVFLIYWRTRSYIQILLCAAFPDLISFRWLECRNGAYLLVCLVPRVGRYFLSLTLGTCLVKCAL